MAKPPDTTLRGKNPSSTFRFLAQVIPEGAGPVKTLFIGCFRCSVVLLVLAWAR
jgi:hypothetical protein